MIILAADTERDQEMIDKFQRAYENLRKIVDRLEDENRKLRQELNEYKKRHPSNIAYLCPFVSLQFNGSLFQEFPLILC